MRFQQLVLIAILSTATYRARAASEPPPSAQDILSAVRLHQSQQTIDVQGQLRSGETLVPFRLTQTGPTVRYTFTDPDEVLQLKLGENDARLEEVTETGSSRIPSVQAEKKIHGTSVTYDDLALRFLYWPNAKLLGDDSIRTRSCWKLELQAPSRRAPYARVLAWVDKDSGALMRVEGYDSAGKVIKRFEVVSAQKIEGRWMLKQMRIEEVDPATNKVQTRTYLEITK